jgi:hypothetical protein
MTTAQMQNLDRKVLQLLQEAREPLTIPDIERQLAGQAEADTFDVRDAVWRLISERRAEFTPKRYIQAAHR